MKPVISVRGLSKRFGELLAVDGLDMDIPERQVYGFLGPNGSGKTTALRMMCGLLEPTAGAISVMGLRVPEQAERVRRQLGYMTQRFSLYADLTARQNLNFLASVRGMTGARRRRRVDELVARYELEEISTALAGSLSGGQQRKLALAAAVIHKPPLLILDEPTSAVDPNTRRYFWDALFEMCDAGATILVTTHLMDEAERCHNVAVMDQGHKVADGQPDRLKRDLGVRVAALAAADIGGLRRRLGELDEIVGITQTGLQLRVLLPDSVDVAGWVAAKLAPGFADLRWESTPTSIEDVFVVSTRGARAR